MFPIRFDSPYELRGIARQPLMLPGESEPAWLYRKAEQARILALPREGPRPRAIRPRLVQKLRLAFARG